MNLANPHDRFFKKMLESPVAAQDLLRHYLPGDIAALLEVSEAQRVQSSFVNSRLKESFSDLIFEVPARQAGRAAVYVLFEHKSSPDPDTPLQLLGYLLETHRRLRRNRSCQLVIPVVFYHGASQWTVPMSFHEFLGLTSDDPFAKYEPNFTYHLCDLSRYSDEELKGGVLLQVVLLTLKHIFSDDLPAQLPRIASLCAALYVQETGLQYVETLLWYLCTATDKVQAEELQQAFGDALPEEGGIVMPTIAEQLVQQGRQEGREQGRQEGRQEGRLEGLLSGLRLALEVKFGNEGLQLLPEIEQRADPSLLERLMDAIRHSTSPDELRQVYAGS